MTQTQHGEIDLPLPHLQLADGILQVALLGLHAVVVVVELVRALHNHGTVALYCEQVALHAARPTLG